MKKKDLLGLNDTDTAFIIKILDTAAVFRCQLGKNQKTSELAGKNVVTLFYENSTRTRMSFEAAAKALGASVSSVSAAASSVQKGESLIDTGKNLDALYTDAVIIRHNCAGAPKLLAENVKASVINAGDGMNEHPTQALLDIFTMREKFGKIKDLKVTIAGDVKFSRVARSNIWGLSKLGASVTVCAPKTLLPAGIESFPCNVETDLNKAISGADVIMGLRIQTERQKGSMFPSIAEYARFYGLNADRISKINPNALIMHPGPANRGAEITGELLDGKNSVVLEQVANGVAVRMAVLNLLING